MPRFQLRVDAGAAGLRLDRFVADRLPRLSRARVQALVESGRVQVDGAAARAAARLRPGQAVEVDEPEPVPATPQPEAIPLRVVHEDSRLLVVDKPAGLVVHPGAGTASGTLVNALLHRVKDLSGVGGVLRPGIVHRLDKGTSGLLLVAKDDETHRALARQFAEREVSKEYLAVVLGIPARREASVDAPIGRDPRHRKRMSARAPRGRPARSDYVLLEALDGAALLRVRIFTGRTHQIRVHLSSLGHPLVGDATYAAGRTAVCRRATAREALSAFARPALHAWRLAFVHPGSGAPLAFESPLPDDLERLLDALRS